MQGRPEIAERHGAGHMARCTARAAHGCLGPARCQTRQVTQNDALGSKGPLPGRPRRHFSAFRPNELWVADIPPQAGGTPSHVRTFSGWVYAAFVIDVYPRRIIGWQTTYRQVCTDLALDALKMTVWQRKRQGLISLAWCTTCDHGVQYRSIRYGQALSDCKAVASVGSKGDSFRLCPGRGTQLAVQGRAHPLARAPGKTSTLSVLATAEWVHWAGTIRPHSAIDMRTPTEHKAARAPDTLHQEQPQPATTASRQTSLHKTQGGSPPEAELQADVDVRAPLGVELLSTLEVIAGEVSLAPWWSLGLAASGADGGLSNIDLDSDLAGKHTRGLKAQDLLLLRRADRMAGRVADAAGCRGITCLLGRRYARRARFRNHLTRDEALAEGEQRCPAVRMDAAQGRHL